MSEEGDPNIEEGQEEAIPEPKNILKQDQIAQGLS